MKKFKGFNVTEQYAVMVIRTVGILLGVLVLLVTAYFAFIAPMWVKTETDAAYTEAHTKSDFGALLGDEQGGTLEFNWHGWTVKMTEEEMSVKQKGVAHTFPNKTEVPQLYIDGGDLTYETRTIPGEVFIDQEPPEIYFPDTITVCLLNFELAFKYPIHPEDFEVIHNEAGDIIGIKVKGREN